MQYNSFLHFKLSAYSKVSTVKKIRCWSMVPICELKFTGVERGAGESTDRGDTIEMN